MTTPITPVTGCRHPLEARTARTDHGTYDYDYEVCILCGCERPVHDDDDRCRICDAKLDGGPGHDWTPVLSPEHVPPEHLAAADLEGAGDDEVRAYLDRRDDAWKAAGLRLDSPATVARLREGIREGSGLWFYDCPECPCDFGTMGSREKAEREAAEHDARYHTPKAGEENR